MVSDYKDKGTKSRGSLCSLEAARDVLRRCGQPAQGGAALTSPSIYKEYKRPNAPTLGQR